MDDLSIQSGDRSLLLEQETLLGGGPHPDLLYVSVVTPARQYATSMDRGQVRELTQWLIGWLAES